jgi:sulfofructose kinase
MSKHFFCVGHASVDHHFEIDAFADHPTKTPAKSYQRVVGGMSANASVAVARLGERVTLLGRVGDDESGHFVRSALQDFGVNQRLESVPGEQTSVSSVVVDAHGERQIFNHRGSAITHAHPLDVAQLEGADALLVDPRWGDGAEAALRWARAQGVLCMLDADVAPRDVLQRLVPLAQWVVFSENGLRCYAPGLNAEQALQQAWRADPQATPQRAAMVTQGARGVLWTHGGAVQSQAAFTVNAVDTTGAGDVFHAALLVALARQVPEVEAVNFACAAAALKCTRRHGVLGAPTRAEVDAFMLSFT